MNNNIYVNVKEIDECLSKLNNIKSKLISVYDSYKNNTAKLQKCWVGKTGEDVNSVLKEHNAQYEVYINNLNASIKFLTQVKQSYSKMDEGISNKLENNSK